MAIFQKQYFKEIALVTGGLWSTCDCPWGRMKERKSPTRSITGVTVLFRSGKISCVFAERKKGEMIYTDDIWARNFNTQTALAWRRCPIQYIRYRAHGLLPRSPLTYTVPLAGMDSRTSCSERTAVTGQLHCTITKESLYTKPQPADRRRLSQFILRP